MQFQKEPKSRGNTKLVLNQIGTAPIATQGSILGPLLFLVYKNDLTTDLKCNVKLFADDTSIFTVVQDLYSAASDINHDLELISQWAHNWRMSFNPRSS